MGPPYQSMFADGSTTLSPARAEIGIAVISGTPSSLAYAVNSSAIAANTFSSYPTRSILLTARTTCGTRSRAAIAACRRVCSTTPLRASTRITVSSAVEAPVTMFRVYCTWPGVSARMNRRRGVAK